MLSMSVQHKTTGGNAIKSFNTCMTVTFPPKCNSVLVCFQSQRLTSVTIIDQVDECITNKICTSIKKQT